MHKWKRYSTFAALAIILVLAFVLRFAAFDHPLAHNAGEGFRDLLTAKHALVYGEWPLAGHANGFSTIDNSPLYYYLVTLLALPSTDFLSVGVLYILFQCATILLLFYCVRQWFGIGAALIAALLMAISPYYIVNVTGHFIWPPYFVAPFVIAALHFLWRARTYHDQKSLVISVLLMLSGSAVHQSIMVVFPLYFFFVFQCGRALEYTRKEWGRLVVATGVLIVVLFTSTIAVSDLTQVSWGSRLVDAYPTTIAEGINQLLFSLAGIFGLIPKISVYIVGLLAALGGWYVAQGAQKERSYLFGLSGLFLFLIMAVALLDPSGIPRHLEPLFWTLFVIVGVLIAHGFRSGGAAAGVAGLVFVFLVGAALTDDRLLKIYPNIGPFERPHYHSAQLAADAITLRVNQIHTDEGFGDYTFFNVYVLGDTHFTVSPLGVWFMLEERLGVPLAESPNETLNRAHRAHSFERLMLVCLKHRPDYTKEECADDYQERFREHTIIDTVFSDSKITVYYAVKKHEQ